MTSYSVTSGTTKLAWIHDGPPGVASLGHFNCPCGSVIRDVEYAGPGNHPCQCGRVWDGRGWLVTEAQQAMDTQPIDPDLFRRTAPKWNCVGYPGDGMHYTPGPNGRCAWCGKSRDQIAAERAARETEPGGMTSH